MVMSQNPKKLITLVSGMIETAKKNEPEPYHLCFYADKLDARSKNHSHISHQILWTFTEKQIRKGLKCCEWERLAKKLMIFFMSRN